MAYSYIHGISKVYKVQKSKGGQQSQLLYVKGPVKQPPVDPRPCNFTWREQMGLGFQEKKVEAIWPLTSDFLILASI